jgi:hypothetical protein
MLEMLRKETALTSRLGNLPDTYSFSKKGFQDKEIDIDRVIFGSSEYVKDGLLPLRECFESLQPGTSTFGSRMD